MASSSDEDKKTASSSVLILFKNAWDEVQSKNPNVGDGYAEILNRFGERKEYTALAFWELMLREYEDHNTDFVVESQSKNETPIFTADNSSQITNTYFENLNLGKDHWFLVQDFPLKNEVLDILRRNLEAEQTKENKDLCLKLIKALENSPPKKTTPNKLLNNDAEKKETTQSSSQQSRNTKNSRNNRQSKYNVRQNLIRSQPVQSVPISMPLMNSVPYNPPFQMPLQSLYPYGQMYYPMSTAMRLPFPSPMPAVYPIRPTVPVSMSVPLEASLQSSYLPSYVRYPSSIVYSQVIPPPPNVAYQVPQIPINLDLPYNQIPQANMQVSEDLVMNEDNEYDNLHLASEDQTIVYFQNENFNYYSDDDNNGSECASSCSYSSGCSECLEQSNENERTAQSSEAIQSNELTRSVQQEPTNITETSVIQEQTVTMEKAAVSSNDESAKQSSKDTITTKSPSTSSGYDKLVLNQKASTPLPVQNQNRENLEKLYLPSTSQSADNTSIRTRQYGAIPKKSVHFADILPTKNKNIGQDTYDERMYLRTPTIFEILDSRKNMDPEEAEKPPTNYMEDVIQRKERRWKQMDKVPGSPRLDTILDMIKKDIEMLEQEEREKEQAQLKIEAEKQAKKVIDLKAADAQLQINIQAQQTSTNINIPQEIAEEIPCDQTEIYEQIILQEPVIVQPLPESEEGKHAEMKTNATASAHISKATLITEKQIVIDDEERELLNKLDNSNSGFKEVWISDKTVTEMKDKLFEKWCKTKPKSRTATTICTQDQQLDVAPEQPTVDDTPTNLPEDELITEAKVYDAKDQSTQTNITKPIRPIVSHSQYTQTVETKEPEIVTYASVVRKMKK